MADQQSEANKHEGIGERLRGVLDDMAFEVIWEAAKAAQGPYHSGHAREDAHGLVDALIAHLSASPEDLAALVVATSGGTPNDIASVLTEALALIQASDRGEGD